MGKSLLVLIFACTFIFSTQCKKQTPEEEEEITILELLPQCEIPSSLPEISGIISINDAFLAHNDGGDSPTLYSITSDCTIPSMHIVDGAINNDWEALTQDDNYIYLGDFGNNNGNRTNLAVYKLKKDIPLGENLEIIEKIDFSYEDQIEFNALFHNYDCEAMISWGDSLYLFSKNRLTNSTNIYALNKTGSPQIIKQIASIENTNLVTDAIYNEERDELYILSYQINFSSSGQFFKNQFMIIENFTVDGFEQSVKKLKTIEETDQFESMVLLDRDHILLAHEIESGGIAKLYKVKIP